LYRWISFCPGVVSARVPLLEFGEIVLAYRCGTVGEADRTDGIPGSILVLSMQGFWLVHIVHLVHGFWRNWGISKEEHFA
jgi:hypothetical protein